MMPEFDVTWLSLMTDHTDPLNPVMHAPYQASVAEPMDGRFEALLASHLSWSATCRQPVREVSLNSAPTDDLRSSRMIREINEQLARIAQPGALA